MTKWIKQCEQILIISKYQVYKADINENQVIQFTLLMDHIQASPPLVQEMDNIKPNQSHVYEPSMRIRIICSYLYFIQGVVISLPMTMTLMYPSVPPYWIISIFAAAVMPFSFKFIEAPFIQKFSSVTYGKRKTWIILSQILASTLIFVGSYFTHENAQLTLAVLFIFILICITLQDISLDAMAIKQLQSPYLAAMTQAIMQTIGMVVGGLAFLKVSSLQFANSIGRDAPLASPSTSLKAISALLLLPTVIIHFIYQQTVLDSERRVKQKSIWEIITQYKVFLNPQTKYCRALILFLIAVQGFNPVAAGYQYELIHKGLKKNTINTIHNIVLIPITILSIYISPKIGKFGWLKCMLTYLIVRWVCYAFVLLTFPNNQDTQSFSINIYFVSVFMFLFNFLDTFYFILNSFFINSFPIMGLSGMFITMLNSGANFGQLKAPSLALIGIWGWKACSIGGLIIEIGILIVYPWAYKKIELAQLGVDAELLEKIRVDKTASQSNSNSPIEQKQRGEQTKINQYEMKKMGRQKQDKNGVKNVG